MKKTTKANQLTVTLPVIFPKRVLSAEYINELLEQSRQIAANPYTDDTPYPITVLRDAGRVADAANRCLQLLKAAADPVELIRSGFELGQQLEQINKNLAVWAVLNQKEAEYKRRKSGADAIHGEDLECRQEAERYFLENRAKWKGNVSAAAREIAGKIVPHKLSTVRRWITALG